jgi:hypothetical protein
MSTQGPNLVVCLRCRAEIEPVPILYGYPTPEAFEEAEAGRIRLGGCMIGAESPEFECPACGGPLPFASEPHGPRRRRTVTTMETEPRT